VELTTRAQLRATRRAALDLHKVLLDALRVDYERAHGRVQSPGELLRLVTQDQAFAWLRPLSQLIVALDECEANPEAGASGAAGVRGELRRLLEAPHFRPHYLECLQREPAVVLAHARLQQHLA